MKKILSMLGVLLGIVTIIVGLQIRDDMNNIFPDTVSDYTFGADFYTEEYKATAAAANNTGKILENFGKIFGYSFMIFGMFEICFFGIKFGEQADNKINKEKDEQ